MERKLIRTSLVLAAVLATAGLAVSVLSNPPSQASVRTVAEANGQIADDGWLLEASSGGVAYQWSDRYGEPGYATAAEATQVDYLWATAISEEAARREND